MLPRCVWIGLRGAKQECASEAAFALVTKERRKTERLLCQISCTYYCNKGVNLFVVQHGGLHIITLYSIGVYCVYSYCVH